MSVWRSAILWLALSLGLLLSACGGGGGGGGVAQPLPPAPPRTDLKVGYYGDYLHSALETRDHTNLYWTFVDWHQLAGAMNHLQHARGAGFKHVVIGLPAYPFEKPFECVGLLPLERRMLDVRFYLTRLRDAGFLHGWESLMIYPRDEPNNHEPSKGFCELSDEVVTQTNLAIRALLAELGVEAKLGVIYALKSSFPGIKTYDRVGLDHYDSGCGVLETAYTNLIKEMAPDALLMLVPGGADGLGKGSRQLPQCFVDYANRNLRVWAIIIFIWFDNWDTQGQPGGSMGVRSNGMRRVYCEAGQRILNPGVTPQCT